MEAGATLTATRTAKAVTHQIARVAAALARTVARTQSVAAFSAQLDAAVRSIVPGKALRTQSWIAVGRAAQIRTARFTRLQATGLVKTGLPALWAKCWISVFRTTAVFATPAAAPCAARRIEWSNPACLTQGCMSMSKTALLVGAARITQLLFAFLVIGKRKTFDTQARIAMSRTTTVRAARDTALGEAPFLALFASAPHARLMSGTYASRATTADTAKPMVTRPIVYQAFSAVAMDAAAAHLTANLAEPRRAHRCAPGADGASAMHRA